MGIFKKVTFIQESRVLLITRQLIFYGNVSISYIYHLTFWLKYGQQGHTLHRKRGVYILDKLLIQTSHQRSAPYTDLYTLTKRCYWLNSKIFSQPEFRNLSTPIKQPIECIQIQTSSLVLILVYIFNWLMFKHTSNQT